MSQEKKTIVINANVKQVAVTAAIATATVMVTSSLIRVGTDALGPKFRKFKTEL